MPEPLLIAIQVDRHDEGTFAFISTFPSHEAALEYAMDTFPEARSWHTQPAHEFIKDNVYELCSF